jgi:hypothetical protein
MGARAGKSSPVAAALALVGSLLLIVGSFMTWATASVDVARFAQALGVDPSLLQGAVGQTSKSFSGMASGTDGKFTLIAGIIAVILAILVFVQPSMRKALAIVLIIAGLVGAGVALYDLSKINDVKQQALGSAGAALQQAGLTASALDNAFSVKAGIGLWACAAGGLVVVIGGVMLLLGKAGGEAAGATYGADAGAAPASSMGTGFETPAAPAHTETPPVVAVAETPAAPPPAAETPSPPTAETPPPPASDAAEAATETTATEAVERAVEPPAPPAEGGDTGSQGPASG